MISIAFIGLFLLLLSGWSLLVMAGGNYGR